MDTMKKIEEQQEIFLLMAELQAYDDTFTIGRIMNMVSLELRSMPLFYINDDTLLSALRCLKHALMGGNDDTRSSTSGELEAPKGSDEADGHETGADHTECHS